MACSRSRQWQIYLWLYFSAHQHETFGDLAPVGTPGLPKFTGLLAERSSLSCVSCIERMYSQGRRSLAAPFLCAWSGSSVGQIRSWLQIVWREWRSTTGRQAIVHLPRTREKTGWTPFGVQFAGWAPL